MSEKPAESEALHGWGVKKTGKLGYRTGDTTANGNRQFQIGLL